MKLYPLNIFRFQNRQLGPLTSLPAILTSGYGLGTGFATLDSNSKNWPAFKRGRDATVMRGLEGNSYGRRSGEALTGRRPAD